MVLANLYKVSKITKIFKQHESYWIAVAETALRSRPIFVNLNLMIEVFQ